MYMEGSENMTEETRGSGMKFCENCGAELAPGAKFCDNCGQKIAYIGAESQTPAQTFPEETPAQTFPEETAAQTFPEEPSQEAGEAEPVPFDAGGAQQGTPFQGGAQQGTPFQGNAQHGSGKVSSGGFSPKIAGVVAYLIPLVGCLLLYFACDREDDFVKLHLNQSLLLGIIQIVINILKLGGTLGLIIGIVILGCRIYGLYGAATGQKTEIPYLSNVKIF